MAPDRKIFCANPCAGLRQFIDWRMPTSLLAQARGYFMSRRTADDIVSNLSGGDFLTTDTFRRTGESVCIKIHEDGCTINLGTSSDRPMYIVEDIDVADDDDFEDAVAVDFDDIRRSATWNAMAALMAANDQRFVVENDDGDRLVGVRIHPDFDRTEVRRFAVKRKQTERDRRILNIESTVLRIAEKMDA
jgi:hypothetical protein